MSPWSWLNLPVDGGGRFPLVLRLLGLAALGLTAPAFVPPITTAAPVAPSPQVATAAEVSSGWVPPTSGAILRVFEPPPEPWAAGHRGVDWEATGDEVVAPGAGTVRFAGPVAGRPVITLAHANGMLSSLEPVTAAEHWSVGDRVEAGELLGTVGPGRSDGEGDGDGGQGSSTAPSGSGHCAQRCVHWGVRIPDGWVVDGAAWDRYLDPLVLLGWSGPSILWPLEGGPPR
ncbi:M23 family metallopeptidase [Citricoccus sp.]|uniref:M23 family metallopeptidase n=1 Tax=Citricoccus sp. TaxID=1978372 RepID=UPI0028BE18E3|nr:M23 family metallopeptidase [Citricoccus sp.]